MKINKTNIVASTIALVLWGANANAAGYSTMLTSTSGAANSYAGSAAGSHDISDMFQNAATISNFDKGQFVFSLSYLDLRIDPDNVKVNGSSTGNELEDAGENAFVPALYFSTPINDQFSFGLAVNSPFGLATKYSETWAGKTESYENKIETFNFNPNISFKVNQDLFLAAGLQAQYAKAVFTKIPGATGALAKTHGSDWGYGYNFGLRYNLNEDIKLGLGYRSKIAHKYYGVTNAPGIGSSDVPFKTDTPESLTAGVAYQAKDNLELAFDVTWTRWSRLKYISFNHDSNSILDSTVGFKMGDSFLYSLGLNYDLNQKTKLRFGTAYEKAAVNTYRNFAIPVSDRIWASTGLRYQLKDDLALDAAYVHQFYKNATVNTAGATGVAQNTNIYGQFKTRVDIYSIGLKKDF